MTKAGKLLALICLGLATGCATPTGSGPAWYCTGTAIVDEVRGLSTANLNADGTVFHTRREWNFPPLPKAGLPPLFIMGSSDEFRVAVMRAPKNYFKEVHRIEIRFNSVDSPQTDSALARDEPHNGSNAYVFAPEAVVQHKNERAFFVGLNRDGRVWWSVPLDLSIIDKGERALELADAQLASMRADFSKRCGKRSAMDVVIA